MHRTDIINHFLSKRQSPTSYLEIGVRRLAGTFNKIKADDKDGVDPNPASQCNHIMTSDEFFKTCNKKYDVIFVDGLHTFEQAYIDVMNSLTFIKDGGTILMHDCNPPTEWHQRDTESKGEWNGTVWKSVVKLRSEHDNLMVYTVDTDFGIGIIVNGKQKLFKCSNDIYTYKVFDTQRKEALNLITVEEFKRIFA